MSLQELKSACKGEWQSIAPEVRPSKQVADGAIRPFYLTRQFKYDPSDKFELVVINYADPFGKVPLVEIVIKGSMLWQGAHPIAAGAQKVDFTADEAYTVKPLATGFEDILNKVTAGYDKWETGVAQSILGKPFPPFGLAAGQIFKEYDLIYLFEGLMFWGARNVDGRGFDTEENRPTNLQIPLIRK